MSSYRGTTAYIFYQMQRTHVNWAKWSDLFTMAHRLSHYEHETTTETSNVERNKHCSHTDIYETMNTYAYDWKIKCVTDGKGIRQDGLSTGGEKSRAAKERIYLNHSGPFPIVFLLLPPSTPFSPYPYYIPLQVQSSPLFSLLFSLLFLPLCAPLWASVWWYQRSRTPPLTDNSLDGTLLCTVQCTAILPQWALDLWWMDRITPSAVSGTCQMEGGGGHRWRFSYGGGSYHICAYRKLGPTGISQVSVSDMEQDGLCGVWFWFLVLKDYIQLGMWTPEAWMIMCLCLLWCPPSPLLLWGLLQSGLHHSLNCAISPGF